MYLILIVILIILLLGGLPAAPWGHYHSYGYWPSGAVGIILVVPVILLLTGRI
jgi:hypothetical protein